MRSLLRKGCLIGRALPAIEKSITGQVIRPSLTNIQQRCDLGSIQSRRSFVSLNDLAKLTPFGQSTEERNKKSSDSSSHSPQDGEGYTETVILPFSSEHLFSVVSDVAAYEEFVPYCIQSRILSKEETARYVDGRSLVNEMQDENGQRQFLAELKVGFGNLQEQYISKVTILPKQGKVIAEAIPTPIFQHLSTSWTLTKISSNSSKVHFQVHYAFSNPFYAVMAKAAMHKMSSQMIGAFERRAEEQQS